MDHDAAEWRARTLRAIDRAARAAGAVDVRPYGSMATGVDDEWSDVDVLVVVPDGRIDAYWPDLDWLPPLEPEVIADRRFPIEPTVSGMTKLMLADGRHVDVMVVVESRAEQRLTVLADLRTTADSGELADIANKVLFQAMDAVGHAVRGERLRAAKLSIGLLVLCADASSLIRDLATGTFHHRGPSPEDRLADHLPAVPSAPGPADILNLVTAALDCLERILASVPSRIPFPRQGVDHLIARARHRG